MFEFLLLLLLVEDELLDVFLFLDFLVCTFFAEREEIVLDFFCFFFFVVEYGEYFFFFFWWFCVWIILDRWISFEVLLHFFNSCWCKAPFFVVLLVEYCGSNVFSGVKYLYFFFDCIGNIIFVFVVWVFNWLVCNLWITLFKMKRVVNW